MTSSPEIVYSAVALRQLVHIGGDSRFAAPDRQAKLKEILSACRDCAAFPRRYPMGQLKDTRERRAWPFKIVYRISDAGIEIIAIWHERQSRLILPE